MSSFLMWTEDGRYVHEQQTARRRFATKESGQGAPTPQMDDETHERPTGP